MALNTALLGRATEPMVHEVDNRWVMSYAAGLGDFEPCYMDTTRDQGVVAHPLFAICPEWPVVLDVRDLFLAGGLSEAEASRGVHASHDVYVHRLIRPGDRLYTQAIVASLEARRPGTYVVLKLETNDALGRPVCTTYQGSLYRQVELAGAPVEPLPGLPTAPEPARAEWEPTHLIERAIDAGAAHVYTECARIWNPIHTDLAVAKAAGLPGLILHGSATLGLAVSAAVEHVAAGAPEQVRRIAGAFRGMVLMPSDLQIRLFAPMETGQPGHHAVRFDVLNFDGRAAITGGLVEIGPAGEHA